jgi:anti-anti-sigma factor
MRESWSDQLRVDGRQAGAIPAPFRIEVEPEREAVRVCPIGEVDVGTVGEVRAQLDELKSSGFPRVVLDLRRTTFLDSSGLHLAVEVNAASAADGFAFALIAGPREVHRVFEVTGLSARLPFVDPRAVSNGGRWA